MVLVGIGVGGWVGGEVKWVCQLLLFGLLLQWLWGTYGHLVVHTLLSAGFSGIRSWVVTESTNVLTKALMSYAVSGAGPT